MGHDVMLERLDMLFTKTGTSELPDTTGQLSPTNPVAEPYATDLLQPDTTGWLRNAPHILSPTSLAEGVINISGIY